MAEDKSNKLEAPEDLETAEPAAKEVNEAPKATTKAGKRSAKSVREAEEKQAKEERKSQTDDETVIKQPFKPTRSKLERQSKKIREASKLIEKDKYYAIGEALELVKKTSTTKFDGSIEVHYNLGVDPRHADQNVRDTLVLPAGTGKTVKVAVLSDDEAVSEKSGADIYGNEHIFSELDKGRINFDILVATPKVMPQLGKYARLLGPRGLMPNPKSGTVTVDVAKAVSESKAGKVEYKVDSNGIVHLLFGKVSFTNKQLEDNFMAVDANIKSNKPNSLKGNYIKSVYLSSTMGPSIKVDISSF